MMPFKAYPCSYVLTGGKRIIESKKVFHTFFYLRFPFFVKFIVGTKDFGYIHELVCRSARKSVLEYLVYVRTELQSVRIHRLFW